MRMTPTQVRAFERVRSTALSLGQCYGLLPGMIEEAEAALHQACLDYAAICRGNRLAEKTEKRVGQS